MKKPQKESVPTSIRLPRDEYDWLREMPGGVPGGIKRALELLSIEEKGDEPTRQLARLIFDLAGEVELETGAPWHTDAAAYRTFRTAIGMASAKWRPAGVPDSTLEPVELKPFQERPHASHPTNDTAELGVWIAHDVIEVPDHQRRSQVRAAREETLKEIVKLQQTRGADGKD